MVGQNLKKVRIFIFHLLCKIDLANKNLILKKIYKVT